MAVGDAAQFTAGLGLDYNIVERLSIDADIRFYDKLNADVGAVKENLELPTYKVADMGVSYKMLLGENDKKSLNFRFNVNNVFHEIYLSELRTNERSISKHKRYGIKNAANSYLDITSSAL